MFHSLLKVSYFASCKCLSDKKRFPFFLRTMQSDHHQVSAIVQLVNHFSWLYVGVLSADNDYSQSGATQFLSEAERSGVCIGFHEGLLQVYNEKNLHHLGE